MVRIGDSVTFFLRLWQELHADEEHFNPPLFEIHQLVSMKSVFPFHLEERPAPWFANSDAAEPSRALDTLRQVLVPLLVEDDPSVRRPLVKFLELHGFAVATAETADQGLEILRKQRLVAAVIDLRLQRGSGRDVVASTPGNIPVIIFSGVPSESARCGRRASDSLPPDRATSAGPSRR